jgi:hypothetical protein
VGTVRPDERGCGQSSLSDVYLSFPFMLRNRRYHGLLHLISHKTPIHCSGGFRKCASSRARLRTLLSFACIRSTHSACPCLHVCATFRVSRLRSRAPGISSGGRGPQRVAAVPGLRRSAGSQRSCARMEARVRVHRKAHEHVPALALVRFRARSAAGWGWAGYCYTVYYCRTLTLTFTHYHYE